VLIEIFKPVCNVIKETAKTVRVCGSYGSFSNSKIRLLGANSG
jgi:hypothetical protein